MFFRFTVHETIETKYSNVKSVYIYYILFCFFPHLEYIFLQGNLLVNVQFLLQVLSAHLWTPDEHVVSIYEQ